MSDWSPLDQAFAANIAITGTSIRLDFPPNRYMVNEPVTLVTVSGGLSEVTVSSPAEAIAGLGEVHNHVMLAFPAAVVGQRAHILIIESS